MKIAGVALICGTIVAIALISAITVSVHSGVDPDVFLRFFAGPAIGNIVNVLVFAYIAVTRQDMKKIQDDVKSVRKQTNGNMTAMINAKTLSSDWVTDAQGNRYYFAKDDQEG